jgi:hypothetical protein
LNRTLDRITDRFGSAAIVTADLVPGAEDEDPVLRGRAGGSRLDQAPKPRPKANKPPR